MSDRQGRQAGRQGVIDRCHFCYFSQAATNILRPSIHISIIIVKLGLEKAKSGNCSADAFFLVRLKQVKIPD
jgi:hypothetical protein